MPTNDPSRHSDQARRLRELADQNAPSGEFASRVMHSKRVPRGIMIGELPSLQRSLSLVWYLANEFCQNGSRCLIVDLSASASALPETLDQINSFQQPNHPKSQLQPTIQPLWQHSAHGRTPTTWSNTSPTSIDILAQPSGDYPTAEQMQRMCEQLVRQLSQQSQQGMLPYETVFFLSSAAGIPVDSACWGVADDILLLWSGETTGAGQLNSAISSRLITNNPRQNRYLFKTRNPTIRDWRSRKPKLRRLTTSAGPATSIGNSPRQQRSHEPAHRIDIEHAAMLDSFESFELVWPKSPCNRSSLNRIEKTAKHIAVQLKQISLRGLSRQAS